MNSIQDISPGKKRCAQQPKQNWVKYKDTAHNIILAVEQRLLVELAKHCGDVVSTWLFLKDCVKQCQPTLDDILHNYNYAAIEHAAKTLNLSLHFFSDGKTVYVVDVLPTQHAVDTTPSLYQHDTVPSSVAPTESAADSRRKVHEHELHEQRKRIRDKQRLPLCARFGNGDSVLSVDSGCEQHFPGCYDSYSEEEKDYKSIPGLVGYRVNARGRVQSCWGRGRPLYFTNEWLSLQPHLSDGRRYVRLKDGSDRRDLPVGKLVLSAWDGEPTPEQPYVWHKNNKMDDDRLENLRWSATKQHRPHKRDRS